MSALPSPSFAQTGRCEANDQGIVNPVDCGADPTDDQDDTRAVAAAIVAAERYAAAHPDGRGVVEFPDGLYRLTAYPQQVAAIDICYDRITLRGQGDRALLRMSFDLNQLVGRWLTANLLQVRGVNDVHIERLGFLCEFRNGSPKNPFTAAAILLWSKNRAGQSTGCSRFEITDCQFRVQGPDLGLRQKYYNIYAATDTSELPMSERFMRDGLIARNRLSRSRGRHIQVSRGENVRIEDNIIENPLGGYGGFGIRLLGGKNIAVRRNKVIADPALYNHEPGFTGIITMCQSAGKAPGGGPMVGQEMVLPGNDLLIEDNQLCMAKELGGIGIYVYAGHGVTVRNNVVGGFHEGLRIQNGEYQQQVRDVRIEHNTFCDSFRWSIKAGNGDGKPPAGVIISDNQFDRDGDDRNHQYYFQWQGAEVQMQANRNTTDQDPCCK